MSKPRIVSPEEAQGHAECYQRSGMAFAANLAHTVATEPDRIRAAVVKALREAALDAPDDSGWLEMRADAIEKGMADL